jgi:hypothetical protein
MTNKKQEQEQEEEMKQFEQACARAGTTPLNFTRELVAAINAKGKKNKDTPLVELDDSLFKSLREREGTLEQS